MSAIWMKTVEKDCRKQSDLPTFKIQVYNFCSLKKIRKFVI